MRSLSRCGSDRLCCFDTQAPPATRPNGQYAGECGRRFKGIIKQGAVDGNGEKQYCQNFKDRVVIEEIRGVKTLGQLDSQFKAHPIQIAKWRQSAMEQLPELFVDGRTRKGVGDETDLDVLCGEIGRLKVEAARRPESRVSTLSRPPVAYY